MFIQPDPYTCVPTSFAYLLHKQKGLDFEKTLDALIKESYKQIPELKKDGMEFEQMQKVAKTLDFTSQISDTRPPSATYLTGVTKLPKHQYELTDFIQTAITKNSLKITKNYFIYPSGHAIVVLEIGDGTANIFDSFFGIETNISLSELKKYLEKPMSYLSLV